MGGDNKFMSETFGIIPTKLDKQLTFGNVISVAEKSMNDFLQSCQLDVKVKITAEIRDNDERYENVADLHAAFLWKPSEHAFFTLDKARGGTEAYCTNISDTLEYWDTYVEETCGKLVAPEQIAQIKKNNVKWYFARSAGQSAMINIAYGHLAAAVAKLTDGILHSKNGWDPQLFPVKADDFLAVYFRPSKTENPASKKWAEKSMNHLRESIAGKRALL